MIIDNELSDLLKKIKYMAVANNLTISTAESCTGGLLAAYLTSIEGASDYFCCGLVTYSNQAKIDLLNVNSNIIQEFGAVSKETAELMALGCQEKSRSSIAIAITGIAGPSGGTIDKPIGTVWFAIAYNYKITSYLTQFDPINDKINSLDNRQIIRYLACKKALNLILQNITI